MSSDTQFHIHHDAPAVVGRRERLGVRMLIVADGAFVAGMIFSYFYLRNLNTNGMWLPEGVKTFSAASGWVVTLPLVVAALVHKAGSKSRSGAAHAVVFLSLIVGLVLQYKQLSQMPFIKADEGFTFFDGSYASSWVLIAGANMFHYLLGSFVALGLLLRGRKNATDPVLDYWRHLTAGSWFTWIAVSGVLCAITTSII